MLGRVVNIEKKEPHFGACDCLEEKETVYFYQASVECSHKMEISTTIKVRSLLVREMYRDNGTLSPRSLQY